MLVINLSITNSVESLPTSQRNIGHIDMESKRLTNPMAACDDVCNAVGFGLYATWSHFKLLNVVFYLSSEFFSAL